MEIYGDQQPAKENAQGNMGCKERKSQDRRHAKQNPIGSGDEINDSLLDIQSVFPVTLFIRRLEFPCFTNRDGNVSKAGDNSQHQKNKGTPRRCFKSAIQINPHSQTDK